MNEKMLKKIILEEIRNVLKEEQAKTSEKSSEEINAHLAREVAGIVGTTGVAYLTHAMKEKLIELFVRYGANRFVVNRVLELVEEGSVHIAKHSPWAKNFLNAIVRNPGSILQFIGKYSSYIIKGAPIVSIIADSYKIGQAVGQMENEYNLNRGTPQKEKAYQETQQSSAAAQTILKWDEYINKYGWTAANNTVTKEQRQAIADAFGKMNARNPRYWESYKPVYSLISGVYTK